MTLAHARAMLASPDVHVVWHTPDRDQKALHALAQFTLRYAPSVAPDPPNGLLMDITGCQRLFQNEMELLNQIARDLNRLGFGPRIATGPTFGSAWAMAHHAPEPLSVIEDHQLQDTLSPLPPSALRIEPKLQEALAEIGIDCIGHLQELPQADLALRFGAALVRRLNQAFGQATETIHPVRPVAPTVVSRLFDGPVKHLESILLAVRQLVEQLANALQAQGNGTGQMNVSLLRSDLPPVKFRVVLSHPSREVQHLWSLVRPHVESAPLGFGVEEIRLLAVRPQHLPHHQARYWIGGGREDEAPYGFEMMLDTMANRLGCDRVLRCRRHGSHIPERTFSYRSVMEPDPPEEPAGVVPVDRPSILLAPPEPIQVIAVTPDGPPSWLRWRGRESPVRSSFGPERIEHEWWSGLLDHQSEPDRRDYFKIQDDRGAWLWIYRRQSDNRWFCHGEWA